MSDQRTNAPHWVAPDLGPRPAAIELVASGKLHRVPLVVHRGMPWMGGTVWVVEFLQNSGLWPGPWPGPWPLCNIGGAWMGRPVEVVEQLTVVLEDPEGSGR